MSKTYTRVVDLLKEQVKHTGSVNAIVHRTGISHNTIGKYLEGIAEPTQASLEKLSKAYGKSVAWLRGDTDVNTVSSVQGEYLMDLGSLSKPKRALLRSVMSLEDDQVEAVLLLLQRLRGADRKEGGDE